MCAWRTSPTAVSVFISPHSHNFCNTCNRVRLTVEGRLLLCLGHENSVDLRALLRRYPETDTPLLNAIQAGLDRKPLRHEFSVNGEVQVVRFMNASGGWFASVSLCFL